ncbi:MAG: CoA-binding protein [Deltaproteobacteria bacterium]|nr:CoA-binding protein [Deltaproteobacteria bacterium]
MAAIDELVKDFLSQKVLAISSPSPNDPASNRNYRTLLKKGYTVYALNPDVDTFDDKPVYPDLKSMPEKVDGVVIITDKERTEAIVRECVELGIPRVWMHDAMGTHPRIGKGMSKKVGSVSEEAVAMCRENNIMVIPGSCPMQFIGDIGHRGMRGFLRFIGALEV